MSLKDYKRTDGQTWAVGSLFNKVDADLFFCMHDFDNPPRNAIHQGNYPLNEIINKYDSGFFTNTISYMLAYALYNEVDCVELYGVDLDGNYEHQSASVCYWIGYLRGKGVEVKIAESSPLCDTDFLYGFQPTKGFIDALKERLEFSMKMLECEKDADKANQWLGQINDIKYWMRRLKQ